MSEIKKEDLEEMVNAEGETEPVEEATETETVQN